MALRVRFGVFCRTMVLFMLLPFFSVPAATAADPPPDLAAMALNAWDLESVGIEVVGFQPFGAHHSILADRARRAAEFLENDRFEYDSLVSDADAVRRANAGTTYLLNIEKEHNGFRFLVVLMAYDDEGAARDGMDAYVSTLERGGHFSDVAVSLDGVDEVVALQAERDMEWDEIRHRHTVVFRTGDMVAAIHALRVPDDTVSTAMMVDLAAAQRDRIQAAEMTGISDLVTRLLRLRIDGAQSKMDLYWVVGGQGVLLSSRVMEPHSDQARRDRLGETGLLDHYVLAQTVYGERPVTMGDRGHATYHTVIMRYDPAVGAPDREAFLDSLTGPVEHLDLPVEGYEALALIPKTDRPDTYQVRVWLDENTIVIFSYQFDAVILDGPGFDLAPAIGSANQLIQHQVACFEGTRSCDRAVASPFDFPDVD